MTKGSGQAVAGRLRAAGCVFAEDEAALLISAAATPAELDAMVDRRTAGLPLEQVLGWAQFCGLRIALDPGVFVPRRRTEFLVRHALALEAPGRDALPVVLDLCCGSGAVGVALAAGLGQVELHAVDVDPRAVACARRNVAGTGGEVYCGDLYQPLPAQLRGRVDLLSANAPYVPTTAIRFLPPEARLHEPAVALDGGHDGLDILRRVLAEAGAWLAPGGHVLVETSAEQAGEAARALRATGLSARVVTSMQLEATVVIATSSRQPSGP